MAGRPMPLILQDEQHYENQRFITEERWFQETLIPQPDGSVKRILPTPTYTVQEAAKFFFGKGADWLRWRSKKTPENPEGFFILDGKPLPDHRTDAGFRYYTLADIERMAHALAQNGGIDGGTLNTIVKLVKSSCHLYGYVH